MWGINNNIYNLYTNNFCNKISNLVNTMINLNRNTYKYKRFISSIKYYCDLFTVQSNNCIDDTKSYYLKSDYNSCYSINLPLKINFNNLKNFYLNYNIINIPKINQVGDMLLNGYFRTPIFYVRLATKYSTITLHSTILKRYLFKLKNNLNLYIDFDGINIQLSLNSYKISTDLFFRYLNIIFKNKYIDFTNLNSLIYILNLPTTKKYSVFNRVIHIRKLIKNLLHIEILNIVGRLTNLKLKKKFIPINNNLINKSVHSFVSYIFNRFYKRLTMFHVIKHVEKLCDYDKDIISLSTILFKENLLLNPTIHYTNQLNSISYSVSKFKLNTFGHSSPSEDMFISNQSIRQIQSDYIGFINVLNTPDGDTCGLLASLANNTIVNNFKLKLINFSDNVMENNSYIDIISTKLDSFSTDKNFNCKKNNYFKVRTIEVLENNEFKTVKITKYKDIKSLNLVNILSTPELVIPFLFNNEPCRGLMGSRMHTQALPLVHSEAPYVVTKYNDINGLLYSKCIYSLHNGVIKYVDNHKIIISDDNDRFIHYYLYPFHIIDYNSLLFYKPTVWEGEHISVGKMLAFPIDLKQSEFTLGFNNLINYSFYHGHEHEDAIVLNKNLLLDDTLTSISFDVYEDYLSVNRDEYIELDMSELYVVDEKHINESDILDVYPYYVEDINELEGHTTYKDSDYLVYDDIITSKIRYELPASKAKKWINFYMLMFINNQKLVSQEISIKIDKGHEGRLVKHDIMSYEEIESDFSMDANSRTICYLIYRLFVFKVDRVKVGDKLCGRHGNKGVISKLVEPVDLPYSFFDLSPYSIVSPIGSLARLNVGQFYEGICGYNGLINNLRIKAPVNLINSSLYFDLYLKNLSNFVDPINNNSVLKGLKFRDFKTGYELKNISLLVFSYYFKLMHTSKSKFQYRTTGTYSPMTQQPHKGKNVNGGQKFGEMEVWALESHGSSYNLKELSLIKTNIKSYNPLQLDSVCSEAFKILTIELKNILINIDINKKYNCSENSLKCTY